MNQLQWGDGFHALPSFPEKDVNDGPKKVATVKKMVVADPGLVLEIACYRNEPGLITNILISIEIGLWTVNFQMVGSSLEPERTFKFVAPFIDPNLANSQSVIFNLNVTYLDTTLPDPWANPIESGSLTGSQLSGDFVVTNKIFQKTGSGECYEPSSLGIFEGIQFQEAGGPPITGGAVVEIDYGLNAGLDHRINTLLRSSAEEGTILTITNDFFVEATGIVYLPYPPVDSINPLNYYWALGQDGNHDNILHYTNNASSLNEDDFIIDLVDFTPGK